MLSLGIKYSTRDLMREVNNFAWGAQLQYASYNVNDVSALSFLLSASEMTNIVSGGALNFTPSLTSLLSSFRLRKL